MVTTYPYVDIYMHTLNIYLEQLASFWCKQSNLAYVLIFAKNACLRKCLLKMHIYIHTHKCIYIYTVHIVVRIVYICMNIYIYISTNGLHFVHGTYSHS